MYVIFPADELILMTYGAVLPRIKPRPTLDCLREPQVPLVSPSSTTLNNNSANPKTFEPIVSTSHKETTNQKSIPTPTTPQSDFFATAVNQQLPISPPISPASVATTVFTYNIEEPPCELNQAAVRRTSRASLTHPFPAPSPSSRQSSVRSKSRSRPATPLATTKIISAKPPTPPLHHPKQVFTGGGVTFSPTQMYNDDSMRASQQSQKNNPTVNPSSPSNPRLSSGSNPRNLDSNNNATSHYDSRLSAYSGLDYPTGALQTTRDRSPSIVLEPPTPSIDPTRPLFAEGWGRPMSPMDLPPEPHFHHSSSQSNKSPTSKSRLRPKLHIPLGKLGRSSSTDQKESQRLREDLQLQIENPIFNSENLRQRNFDAFFESGEPVYKLQPKQPLSAPADGASTSAAAASLPPLDHCAGVYDSLSRTKHSTTSGKDASLFARSPNEDRAHLSARSKSIEHYEPSRETRASSVSAGVPQKGDRFFGKIFKWTKKS